MEPLKILMIATSHGQLGDSGRKTGLWLETLAAPYLIFREAGALITIASPKGGEIPLDPRSESIIVATSYTRKFQKDPVASSLLLRSVALNTLNAMNYHLVLLCGGHGAMWDLADNAALTRLLEDFVRQNRLIATVSQGAAALASLHNETGEWLVKDRNLTAFSNSEEKVAGSTELMPFLLESRLLSLGAIYTKEQNYTSYTVTDGRLMTGQNSSSSPELARKILVYMKLNAPKDEPRVIALN
ncbi:MAG TPA: type 1 glutamine amidotransferase domain-containing protein [Puia sp.]|nr:type 1 glutamine amidotransferase domain-containing protein [Puia sp.]